MIFRWDPVPSREVPSPWTQTHTTFVVRLVPATSRPHHHRVSTLSRPFAPSPRRRAPTTLSSTRRPTEWPSTPTSHRSITPQVPYRVQCWKTKPLSIHRWPRQSSRVHRVATVGMFWIKQSTCSPTTRSTPSRISTNRRTPAWQRTIIAAVSTVKRIRTPNKKSIHCQTRRSKNEVRSLSPKLSPAMTTTTRASLCQSTRPTKVPKASKLPTSRTDTSANHLSLKVSLRCNYWIITTWCPCEHILIFLFFFSSFYSQSTDHVLEAEIWKFWWTAVVSLRRCERWAISDLWRASRRTRRAYTPFKSRLMATLYPVSWLIICFYVCAMLFVVTLCCYDPLLTHVWVLSCASLRGERKSEDWCGLNR